MCALRSEDIGSDTYSYLTKYKSVELNDYSREFIFYSIAKFCNFLGLSSQIIQIVMTSFIYIPLIILVVKYIQNTCLAILVFIISTNGYFFETFNIVRQSAATVYLLWGYVELTKKNYFATLLAFLFAIGFHTTSIIYIVLILFAYKIQFSTKFVICTIIGSLIFAFYISNIDLISNLITSFSELQMAGTEKYGRFVEYKMDLIKNTNGLIVMLIPFSVLSIYAYNYFRNNLLMKGFYLGTIFLNLIAIMPTSYRMAYGLISIEVLLIPMIYSSKIKNKWIPTTILLSLIVLWIWKLPDVLVSSSLIPYKIF
ncbi:MAG: EpsG family protein [Muribaculum sp.]|nr:EpsG family protein [Muribaculum sp.]